MKSLESLNNTIINIMNVITKIMHQVVEIEEKDVIQKNELFANYLSPTDLKRNLKKRIWTYLSLFSQPTPFICDLEKNASILKAYYPIWPSLVWNIFYVFIWKMTKYKRYLLGKNNSYTVVFFTEFFDGNLFVYFTSSLHRSKLTMRREWKKMKSLIFCLFVCCCKRISFFEKDQVFFIVFRLRLKKNKDDYFSDSWSTTLNATAKLICVHNFFLLLMLWNLEVWCKYMKTFSRKKKENYIGE